MRQLQICPSLVLGLALCCPGDRQSLHQGMVMIMIMVMVTAIVIIVVVIVTVVVRGLIARRRKRVHREGIAGAYDRPPI